MEIDVFIDRVTPCLFDKVTSKLVKTTYREFSLLEVKKLTKGWGFNWVQTFQEKYRVYGITLETGELQGLISLALRQGFIEVSLVESAPSNVGKDGRYEGVGGHLFAIAAKLSYDLGAEGFVSFIAKTSLIEHYKKTLNAKQIGNTQLMFIDSIAADILVKKYFIEEVSEQ